MKNGVGVEADRIGLWSRVSLPNEISRADASGLKRAMDLAIALPLLVFLSPLLVLIYALIRLADQGPALFTQLRVGRGGKTFLVYKFRTMPVDAAARLKAVLASDPAAAAEWARFQKLRNDPRVTLLGRFLRKTSLDELPQLYNILRGEMSVVGPRPVTSNEIHRYGAQYSFYTATRPGVVGLWQVSGRNRLSYRERVALDTQYVKTWSIWADLMILLRAIPVVLFGLGAY